MIRTPRVVFVVVAFAIVASGCALSRPKHAETLRVMTFNIRLNLASDGPNAWPFRKELVASLMNDADLVGVQEALPDQLRDLDSLLPQFGRFGVGRASDRGGEHSAILYRKDRFEVLEQSTFWLSESPETAGSKGWDAAYERIVTWGKLRDRRTGKVFFHFNTHFDHVGERARRESALLLLRRIEEIAGPNPPVIVTGDFNAAPDSEPYRLVTAGGLRDAFVVSICPHRGPTSTWNAFRQIEPDRRIDFIFVRGAVDVIDHAILPDSFDGRFPSDHLPVVARLRIGGAGQSGPCPP